MEKDQIPKYIDSIPVSDKLYRLIWRIVCLFLFYPFSLPLFNWWRVFLLRLFGAKIGKGCVIYSSTYIPSPKMLIIGDMTCIGPNVSLHFGKTILGNKVTISQGTYLCSASHDINSLNTPLVLGEIIIHDFAWVAAEVFIMMDVTIEEGAIIGARSAVFKGVSAWDVVGGNPAKFIKKRIIRK